MKSDYFSLFQWGTLFTSIGTSVSSPWNMGIPACHGAEVELKSYSITG